VLTTIAGIVILLGGLIFFHEFGHYLVAKLLGVTVEIFSIGFGKKLLKKKIGETEYCLSLFPLGGYVKLLGDDPYKGVPPSEAERAFFTQKLYKRFLIVAAGPIANLLLAFFLFVGIFWYGKPVTGTKIGTVIIGSEAWNSGLRSSDKIVSVLGKKITTWAELEEETKKHDEVELEVLRDSVLLNIKTPISEFIKKNIYGEDELTRGIKGILPTPILSTVGVSANSIAYKSGIRTGDMIEKIGNQKISTYEELNKYLISEWRDGKELAFLVKRFHEWGKLEKFQLLSFTLVLPKLDKSSTTPLGVAPLLGFWPSELVINKITPQSPAEKGGIWPLDRVVKIGDVPIYNFETIVEQVQIWGKKNEPAPITLERESKIIILKLQPQLVTLEDPFTKKPIEKYIIGFSPFTAYGEAELVSIRYHNIGELLINSTKETLIITYRMIVSIGKLISGKVSIKNLGGPVLIASVAGKSLVAGIIPFLQIMALISINLFLLNLFPIPILDGGHLMFFLIEAIKGKPVSLRTMEIANQVGMFVILFLIGLTLFNDISRMVGN